MTKESVWNYPRPPKVEAFSGNIKIKHQGEILAQTNQAYRVLETSHPPTYYLPPEAINLAWLKVNNYQTWCEFKGKATYFDLEMNGKVIRNIGWAYKNPNVRYAAIKDCITFYASKVEEILVNGEKVQPQKGDFYGGWITSNIEGPFKGGPGTVGW